MSDFHDAVYVSRDGFSAPVDPSATDNPYFGHSNLAKSVLMGDLGTIQWRTKSQGTKELHFKSPVIAAIDPSSDLLIVILAYGDTQFRRPANAAAFRANGDLDHVITPPAAVEQVVEQLPGQAPRTIRYPVEAMAEVLLKNGRSLIGLEFRYEWVERRYYDPIRQQWLERDQIYRR
ncbi:hypothetical protein NX773_18370 [Massilia solisilvae]|uniref:Pyridoxamine 5'-phosphate oxidase family protein n=1 Tax=Massilia solisilvae TaxID=1811225 RepID=A0ABT2BNP3_9BURK|nr:hypothetical protein [Massilia solisilvae]MCS0610136.1 hypothetical protein [Massilia solisilvae]